MTGRECGDVRGLAEFPKVAAEVLEGYFGSEGFPLKSMGSKPQAGLASLQHQSQKGTQIKSSYKKQQGFCQTGRDGWRCRELFKGPKHRILFAVTYPGCW